MTTNCDPGGPGLADGACRTLVQEGVHGLLGRGACRLDAYVVMPTHVHILFVLAETKSLSDTMRDFKKYTALRVNRRHGRTGEFWLEGFHDHAIRSHKDYLRHLEYILKNPVRDGLVREGEQYRYLGWGPWEEPAG